MSRGVKQRLAGALPIAVAVLGAGLGAAMKRRAGRRARLELGGRVVVDSQAPELHVSASYGATAAPTDAGPDLAGTVREPDERSAAPTGPAAGRAVRGVTTTKIIEALATGGTMTAAEVALATGIGRSTISSTLSRLARTGAVTKAERGYRLPDDRLKSRPAAKKRAPRARAPKSSASGTPSRTPPRSTSARGRSSAGTPVASTSAPAAHAGTRAKVLSALTADEGMTAGEVATATGLGRGPVSTMLSKLSKTGEVVKATRGYRLPD